MEEQEYLRLEEKKPIKNFRFITPSTLFNYQLIASSLNDEYIKVYIGGGQSRTSGGRIEEGRRHIHIKLRNGEEYWIAYGEIKDGFNRRLPYRVRKILKDKKLYEEIFRREEQFRKLGKLEKELLRF